MVIKNKKGFALPDVLLAVVAMGIITSGLLQFFNSLQSEKNSPQNLAMEFSFLHQKLNMVDPLNTDRYTDTSGNSQPININTDILNVAFPALFKENKNSIESYSVSLKKYSHDNGLLVQIPINHPTIHCASLLRYNFGFSSISPISSPPVYRAINELPRTGTGNRVDYCKTLEVSTNWEFYLK